MIIICSSKSIIRNYVFEAWMHFSVMSVIVFQHISRIVSTEPMLPWYSDGGISAGQVLWLLLGSALLVHLKHQSDHPRHCKSERP